ncbi:hypothetical protein LINPERHAP2_LOCUS32321 [Linum perenne]
MINALLLTSPSVNGDDGPKGACDVGKSGVDLSTAVKMKTSLIVDLAKVVPTENELHYCNQYVLDGITMYGYGECTRRPQPPGNNVDLSYCTDCLSLVGYALIENCDDTGAGHAWDVESLCYLKVGFTVDVCPLPNAP